MATSWPSTIPSTFNPSGFSYKVSSGVITSANAYGPSIVRKRTTAQVEHFAGSIQMTTTEFTAFRSFFRYDVQQGSLTFNFPNPITDAHDDIEVKFTIPTGSDPYTSSNVGFKYWTISFAIQTKPQ